MKWLLAAAIAALWALAANAVLITNDTLIAIGDTNLDGLDLAITNCTVIIDGPHAFNSVRIWNGGRLTHSVGTNGLLTSEFSVTNELHVLTGTDPVPLNYSNVVLATIVVADTNTPIIYTNGADYLTSIDINGFPAIERTPASSIPDGAGVLVSYNALNVLAATGLNLTVTNDFLVEVGGNVDVNGRGYDRTGPGGGGSAGVSLTGAGGGHGGFGGLSASNAPGGAAHDLTHQPFTKGGGGGLGSTGPGGLGGGYVRADVGGTLRVDGTVSANGADGLNSRSGGGAGGGVFLTALTFTGSGSITAHGGAGEPSLGGGGGGGRIAVLFSSNNFSGTLGARGGKGWMYGGAGTVYTKTGSTAGDALVENGGKSGTNTLVVTGVPFSLTVKSGAVVSVNAQGSIGSLVVGSNAAISLSVNALTVTGPVLVESGGAISADGTALSGGFGHGNVSSSGGSGAGHAGLGAPFGSTGGGLTYGSTFSIVQPSTQGSSGGNGIGASPASAGGRGGGLVQMTIGGLLTVNGRISSDGQTGPGENSGGGSGGSVWLNVGGLAGTGIISASGGAGNGLGGSGGGGRIAIYFQSNNFAGALQAWGGSNAAGVAGAGTIYTRNLTQQVGQVLIDNRGNFGTNTPVSAPEAFDLTIQAGAIATLSSGVNLGSLTVGSNALILITNTTVTVSRDTIVFAGGAISADGNGFGSGIGPGAGRTATYFPPGGGSFVTGGGAGHGGYGGSSSLGAAGGLTVTDTLSSPASAGSGGGGGTGNFPTNAGGTGGGVLRLTVSRNLIVNGRISADGLIARALNGGGGAGGSIFLSAATVAGSGIISANGGANNNLGGGGGGGRIAVNYQTNLFTGSIQAAGGGTTNVGGAGTLYLKSLQTIAQVIADNGGRSGTNTSLNELFSPFDLTVRGAATVVPVPTINTINNLIISSNSWLRISNSSITVSANATVEAGGGILADGTGYPGGQGPGLGITDNSSNPVTGGGGAYGGYGGAGTSRSSPGGVGYGNNLTTLTMGSGGGAGSGLVPTNAGGAGGGKIQLTINGSLVVNGKISANGVSGQTGNSGGGAGGGISITAVNLSGIGSITANGGAGVIAGGGGGGGRIVLRPNLNQFSGVVSAFGGSGANRGGAGVIYTRVGIQNIGTMLIDNGGPLGTNTALLESGSLDLVITGGGVGLYSIPSLSPRVLTILSNGWLKVANQQVNITSSASVQAGGGIIADAAATGLGQGSGSSSLGAAGGGGYGGAGGANQPNFGRTYGQLQTPLDMGSAGASMSDSVSGGRGGGLLRLTVSGPLVNDGRISSNGGDGGGPNSGGGSGGTVSLNVSTLLGSGVISANGGAGLGLGGGGGGGRIALAYGSKVYNGKVSAAGGAGLAAGGAGTIYQKASNEAGGLVLIDNNGQNGTNSSLGISSGTIDIALGGGARLTSLDLSRSVRNLSLTSNSFLLFSNQPGQVTFSGDVTIASGAAIVADAAGLNIATGGGGNGATISSGPYGITGGGGGHGGFGAASFAGAAGGIATDSPINPILSGGSGGFGSGNQGPAAVGGGVIVMSVSGGLTINGRLSANGATTASPGAGGGAGGSINIVAAALTGAGLISADGGAGNGYGGGGAGGRIAFTVPVNSFSGAMSARGGTGAGWGGAGTIYTRSSSKTVGRLLVDNGGHIGAKTPLDNWELLDLELRNGGLGEPTNTFLTISNLIIGANGHLNSGKTNFELSVLADMNIASEGFLSADANGFTAGNGPGAGLTTNSIGGGAGYGGAGGASSLLPGGATYGSASHPVAPGSGGGLGALPSIGGSQGGGGINLSVGRLLTINGSITAEGNSALDDNAGGGSGGSLLINAALIAGSGIIAADGGAGELYQGGGGGGGRIAIYSRNNSFAGTLSVLGGDGASAGGLGTIVIGTNAEVPAVISQTPSGAVSNGVGQVVVTFNIPINPFSVSSADISLTGPVGMSPIITSSLVTPTTLRLSFPLLTSPGPYNLSVGPQIQSIAGEQMSGVYNGSFTLVLPVIQGMITDDHGQPVPGIVLQPSVGSPATTDATGTYVLGFSPGTSFSVTPLSDSWMFVPGVRNYPGLSGSISNENYLAVTTIAPSMGSHLQGTNLVMSWVGLAGVTYDAFYSTDLVNWFTYTTAIPGTNGPMELLIPVPYNNQTNAFFRLSARNY